MGTMSLTKGEIADGICSMEELLQKAKAEIGETDEEREKNLIAIREWLQQVNFQPNIDNLSILWFLRGCKYDVGRTKSRINNYYSFRIKITEWYSDRDPKRPEILELLNVGCALPLPGRDREGRKVVIIRASRHNPSHHKQDDVFKVGNMIVELLCCDEETISLTGVVAVIDLHGMTFGHAMQMTPSMIRKAVHSWQDVYPVRTKGMHFINTPINVHVVLNIFKQFMKEKLRKRVRCNMDALNQKYYANIFKVHVHRGNGVVALQSLMDHSNLPKEYGGNGPSVNTLAEEWKEKVLRNREWFVSDTSHGPFSL